MPQRGEAMPPWVADYLANVRSMLEEADRSKDPRVKMTALRILERQVFTIRELEFDHWADSMRGV
jgi:hypothetical protein